MTLLIASRPYPIRRHRLSQAEFGSLRKRLLELRAEVLDEIDRLREVVHDDSEHLADDPDRRHLPIEEDHEVTAALIDREQLRFEAIERALQRMDDGTYGICVETGLPIPTKRLQAIPYAERLVGRQLAIDAMPT